jgi:hypothetical protein
MAEFVVFGMALGGANSGLDFGCPPAVQDVSFVLLSCDSSSLDQREINGRQNLVDAG